MNNASKNIIEEMFRHYYNEPMKKYYDEYDLNKQDLNKQDLNSLLNNNLVSPAEIVNIKLASDSPRQFIKNLFVVLQNK